MYGQANYGPQPPRALPYQQHPPPLPPPPNGPNFQFQQGPQPRPSPLIQQPLPAIPPHVNQPCGPRFYQHGPPPAPPPPVHPVPPVQIPPFQVPNESYRLPPPPPPPPLVSQVHFSGQQAQHSSHLGAQNVHHNPTVAPPSHGPARPEILQTLQPPGGFPPPPQSQGQQTSYTTAFFPPPPYPGGMQGLNHIPPPPPPPTTTSSFFTPIAYGSSVQTTKEESHVSSTAPPPPSSSPPIPPSPPLSTDPSFTISKLRAPSSGEEAIAINQVRDGTSIHGSSQNFEGNRFCEAGSQLGDVRSLNVSEMLNLPPPPLKPTEPKTIQRIEDLCLLIAKNGPGVEDVTRQNEYGNPEYEFLFGDDPGSEAAIGYEYFLWLKKKRLLEHKFHEEQREPAVMPLQMDSSRQPNASIASADCTSTADSDMEMEDDITIFDGDQEVNHSTEALINSKERDAKEQLHAPKISPEFSLAQDISPEKLSCGSSLEQSEGLSSKSDLRFHSQVTDSVGAVECSLDSDLEKIVLPVPDNLVPSGASIASEAINSKKHLEVIKGGNPIRLLQDYASDDNSENDDELLRKDINPLKVLPSCRLDESSPSRHTGSCVETDLVPKSQHCIGKKKRTSRWQSESNLSQKAIDGSSVSHGDVKAIDRASITIGRTDGYVDSNAVKESSVKDVSSHVDFQKKVASDGADSHVISRKGMAQKENEDKNAQFESASLKVDEFGRLAREGSTDSDSDSWYTGRHEKRGKRGRNWSRSRSLSRSRSHSRSRSRSPSPLDRRRTRRSLWRRKEKRSRSRSWSPRKRRSRSRSPAYRRAGEFSGEKLRSDRGRIPVCFDFIRGSCLRGARCRYMHNEGDKTDTSRHHRREQNYLEVPSGSKNYKTKIESRNTSEKLPERVRDEPNIQEMQDRKVDWEKEDILMDSQKSITLGHSGQLIDSGIVKCQSPREIACTVQEKQIIQESSAELNLQIPDNRTSQEGHHQLPSVDNIPPQCVDGADIWNSCGDNSREDLALVKDPAIHQPQSHNSVAEDQNGDCLSHEMECSSVSDASPKQRTLTSPKKFSKSESFSSNILPLQTLPDASSSQALLSEPIQFPAPKELSPLNYSVPTISQQSLQLPPPPPFPHVESANAPHMAQFPMNYSSMPQVASYPLQRPHVGNSQTYQAPVASQPPQFSVPPNSSWTSLPLPPPPPRLSYDLPFNTGTATPSVSSQFHQSHFPPRNDYGFQISAYPNELHSNSIPHGYPSTQEPHQPNVKIEISRSGNSTSKFGAPSLLRDDHFTHPPVQEMNSSSSLGHGSLHQQPVPSSQELSMNIMVPFSSEVSNSSSEIHPFSQRQMASGHLQYPLGDSSLSAPGKPGSMSQYQSDLLDRNQSSSEGDFRVSRFSAHYNPYASTFDQPLGSKFSSSAFSQDKGALSSNQYDTPFGLRHVAVDGQVVGSFGSRQTTSSPGSAKAVGQIMPTAGDDKYDPLFDSISPSSNCIRKDHHGRKLEPVGGFDPIEKHGSSYKPLDLEEKNRHAGAAVASTMSLDNDEFGETADAEVGSVENESPIKAADIATAGEMGTERKSPGKKKKKKKDSRSTKPFKIAIADFVKDVLKPSWRQGNMSKEAFKTIVKKTVDKVSGAMKGHQMPKSQAKISQYIDSQQRKLTKLVMGYVDKYVKV